MLDLSQLRAKLKEQSEELDKKRAEIEEELKAIDLVEEASKRVGLSGEQTEQEEPTPARAEETAEVDERRELLEESIKGLELDDEVAILELLKISPKPLLPDKIADELLAVQWDFQDQDPLDAVEVALKKMLDEGKVKRKMGFYEIPA